MQILEICLYNHNGEKRVVPFKTGTVNIISGDSATGKSALMEIVDYCLGKTKCTIPSGPIRKTVAWYGVLLQFNNGRMFIARENPSIGSVTSTATYIEEGDKIASPPEIPQSNINIHSLVKRLSRRIGISPNLHIPSKGQTRDSLSASIRHALVYCYQKQTEIASNKSLFHRQDYEGFVANSISDSLEYFLGAVGEDSLDIQQKLDFAKRELSRRQKELQEAQQIRGEGVTKAVGIIAEAREIGLISDILRPKTLEEYSKALQTIVDWKPRDPLYAKSNLLDSTQNEIQELKRELRDLDEKITMAKSFTDEIKGFTNQITNQEKRLESVNLFDYHNELDHTCPFCNQSAENKLPTIRALRDSLEQIKKNLEITPQTKPQLLEHIYKLEEKKQQLLRTINEKREEISKLVNQEEDLTRIRDENLLIGQVLGKAKFWLESVTITDEMSPLTQAVRKAESNVKELDSKINRNNIESRLKSILLKIDATLTMWAINLRLENCGDPVFFDVHHLDVGVQTKDEFVNLERMGSAQNWLGYHLIVNLSLHKHFRQNNRPVPGFLFLDQPSQAYYPADQPRDPSGLLTNLKDEDRIAVERLYNFIFTVVDELKPDFQVIMTDHAKLIDNQRFMDNLVEEWRHGNKLIPESWIQNS